MRLTTKTVRLEKPNPYFTSLIRLGTTETIVYQKVLRYNIGMEENGIEIYQSEDGSVKFYIALVNKECSAGLLVLSPGSALPKHNRPLAVENLTQISGTCLMTLFDENDQTTEITLHVGEGVKMPKGQWHIHANPFQDTSITLWKAEGDIVDIINQIKQSYKKVTTNLPKNLV